MKYNLIQAREERLDTLLTFGGAFSNHIAATAAAGKAYGFKTIGIIRGEELAGRCLENPTLAFAAAQGMNLNFVSRTDYRDKDTIPFTEALHEQHGSFYLVPEGGTNLYAVKGCTEILSHEDASFTHIACAVGTGGTISGIINSAAENQQVLGFPALKGGGLSGEICKFAKQGNWKLVEDYHFGGYGKINGELVAFMNSFFSETGIPLDPVYTGKMVFGVIDLVSKGFFPAGSRILMIHTGGLQGITGMNLELARRKLPLLKIPDHA